MSMEHKAFLFNTKKFHDEIEDIIFECTKANNIQIAIDYINANLDSLYSPYTEEQLDEHWESEIDLNDPPQMVHRSTKGVGFH